MTRSVASLVVGFWLACIPCLAQNETPKLRLPTTVRPVRYSADLRVTPGEDHFSGSITIELEISQAVSTVWVHGKSLIFEKATFRVADRDERAQATPATDDFVAITTGSSIPPGRATLQITYTGEVSRTLTDGAFQQQQGDDWYVFTKFEPVTARRVFPSFDEPSFKVPWQLTLHVPEHLKAFSNTTVVSEKGETNGMKAVRFAETKPLPSYLVAFAVGPFDIVETDPVGKNRRPSRIIVPRGRTSEAAYAAAVTPKLIGMLEEYFGTPYPYDKLDQIVVPLTTAWGAMENAGLIAYGDFLLSPNDRDTELRQRECAGTMEHEMSHQWFGDLVTTAWWDDIWLNEAFASWISSKLLNEWKPEWNIKADAARSSVMRSDSLTTARKIRQPIEAPGDIANAFDGITYGKGEAVIGMFENYMGAKEFQRAIRLYLLQHAWGNATSADLLASLDSVSGQRVGAAFSTFLNQVGFPIVSVKLSCPRSDTDQRTGSLVPHLELAQQRFLPVGSQGATDALWAVPVCATWGDDGGTRRQCALLTKAADRFDLNGVNGCPAWLFADSDAAGYYAVSYDAVLANKLIKNGLSHLKTDESAAALRNIQLMFSSGVGETEQELAFVSEFSHSADPGLVRQAAGTVRGVSDFVPGDLSRSYARLVRSLYDARARELGWKSQSGESQEVRLLRMEISPLAATYGEDPDLLAQAALLARGWLKDRQSLDPDMVKSVLSVAAWNGDRAFFDLLVTEIRKDKIQRERAWMISALNSFRDPAITNARLELIFGSGIDPRELQYTLFGAPPQTREIVWEFVQRNFDRLNSTLPGARGIPFGALLPLTAAGFCDTAHQQQVESFFQPRIATLPGGARNLANTVERIRLCTARAAVIKPAITSFLNKLD